MAKIHKRTQEISQFILENVTKAPTSIGFTAAAYFGLTRQGINRHLQRLVKEELLTAKGTTRNKTYALAVEKTIFEYEINKSLSESTVWLQDIAPVLGDVPDNVDEIWHYGFTEMLNNVIDHANASKVSVIVEKSAINFGIVICDNGEGIFKKIQKALDLADERHAVLELAKGKYTSDPANHSGEGIFFTSRMLDFFVIASGTVRFTHDTDFPENTIHSIKEDSNGTCIIMLMNNNAKQLMQATFDDYTTGNEDDTFGFTQTVVPVELAQYGDSRLISRSQAKRLLVRIDRFKTVILDFKGVETIGQAFADEIFRVFQNQHPEINLLHLRTSEQVEGMIQRALAGHEK